MSEALCPKCNKAWKITHTEKRKPGQKKNKPLKVVSISDPCENVAAYIRKRGCADCAVFGHTAHEKNAVTVARFLKRQAAKEAKL